MWVIAGEILSGFLAKAFCKCFYSSTLSRFVTTQGLAWLLSMAFYVHCDMCEKYFESKTNCEKHSIKKHIYLFWLFLKDY